MVDDIGLSEFQIGFLRLADKVTNNRGGSEISRLLAPDCSAHQQRVKSADPIVTVVDAEPVQLGAQARGRPAELGSLAAAIQEGQCKRQPGARLQATDRGEAVLDIGNGGSNERPKSFGRRIARDKMRNLEAVELPCVLAPHLFDFLAFKKIQAAGFRSFDLLAPNRIVDPAPDGAFQFGSLRKLSGLDHGFYLQDKRERPSASDAKVAGPKAANKLA